MSQAAIVEYPQKKPIERAYATIHQLLRRGTRIVAPLSDEERAAQDRIRAQALDRLNADAAAYHEWKLIEAQARDAAARLKPGIMDAVEILGIIPDSAPKSQRADTVDYVCTVTTGTTLEIDDEAVLEFDLSMHTKALRRVFDLLFIRRVEYTLAPSAHQLMQHGKLPTQMDAFIRKQFSRAFSAKTTSPSLSVDSKADLEAKRLAAEEKAAAKTITRKSKKGGE